MIILKSETEIEAMRRAGLVVGMVLETIGERIKPGVTTAELDRFAENLIREQGGTPTFKGYNGFPASICSSINEQVVHGIPGQRTLKPGDIVSIDVGATLGGFVGDAARTYPVGDVSPEAAALMQVTRESLYKGIEQAIVGNRLSDVSHAVQRCVEGRGFSVVRDYVGHGIGREMHESPGIPNYGVPGRGPKLKEGMTLAIEPMVNAGSYDVQVLGDDWTVVTRDGSLSAHFEHTVAVTAEGPEILTLGPAERRG